MTKGAQSQEPRGPLLMKILTMNRAPPVGDINTSIEINKVTPESAVPDVSAHRLQKEVLGKYASHFPHYSNRQSRVNLNDPP